MIAYNYPLYTKEAPSRVMHCNVLILQTIWTNKQTNKCIRLYGSINKVDVIKEQC